MLSFMNFKGTVVNQMITPHNETRFLSDQLKKKQSQQKKCDFSATQSNATSVRSAFALPIRPLQDVDVLAVLGFKIPYIRQDTPGRRGRRHFEKPCPDWLIWLAFISLKWFQIPKYEVAVNTALQNTFLTLQNFNNHSTIFYLYSNQILTLSW